jgi:acyl-[acyl-carrier-protein]-phospholipid O-acyltransferase / long-chain-fatty-acid--[acyl-carrier-protein] ligase
MLKIVMRLLLRIFFRVEVSGNMTKHDRMLIIANHQSFLDGVLMGAFLPVDPYWLVNTEIANQWHFKILLKFVNHMTLDPTNPFAIKQAMALIESGKPVGIFPEGRITVTAHLMKVYEGTAFMAAKTGAKVVCVHIQNAVYCDWASRMDHREFPGRAFPKIRMVIHDGKPIEIPSEGTSKERRRIAGERMKRMMQEMVVTDRKRSTIFEHFLDTYELFDNPDRDIIEDIRPANDTFGTCLKASLALGRLISKISAEKEVVGVLLPNAGPALYTCLGMWAFNRVPAMINYTAGLDGMQSAIRAAKIKTILTSKAFLAKAPFGKTILLLKDVEIVYLEDLRPKLTLGDKLWLILWALRRPRSVIRPGKPDDPAVVLFTSGSEGKPKGVVLSHDALYTNVMQLHSIIDIQPKDKFLSSMPLFHAFGLMGGFLVPLLTGSRMYLYPSPLHYRIIPEIAYDRNCTIMFATNTFLANYAKRAHPYDFRSVRIVVSGAEKLTDEVRRLYSDKFGVRIIEAYGATECAPGVCANTPMLSKNGTVGPILPGMEWKLETVPGIDEGALLHVKGPNVMLGYWKESNPGVLEPPSSTFGPGWYPTGDIVSVDSDGFVKILGRVKRFAKVAGEMVSLEIVEKLAEQASPKLAHASTTIPDAKRGEAILLVTQDRNLKRDQLQAAARELGAPDLAIPRQIIYVDKIPLLGSGKKDYPAVKQIVEKHLQQQQGAAVEA